MRDFAIRSGIDLKLFLLKDFASSSPLPCVKHLQFSGRRPQQFRGMCRCCFEAGLAALRLFLHVLAGLARHLFMRSFLMPRRARRRFSSETSCDSNLPCGLPVLCRCACRPAICSFRASMALAMMSSCCARAAIGMRNGTGLAALSGLATVASVKLSILT